MGSFHLSSANSVSGQENFVSFSALWASAHPRFSFPAGFRQFRLRLRKNLGFFRLLPEISASQPGNSIPFPPGFCKFLPQCEIFFPPFPPIFSPLRGPFRTSKFVLFPACFPFKKKKNSSLSARAQHFGLCHTKIWGILVNFSAIPAPPEQPFPIPNNSIPLFQQRRWN